MDKRTENINLGLTKDELELLVKNANNHELLEEYNHKLDNCDLSKSAIELIDKSDLAAVNRISNGITSKYKVNSSNSTSKFLFFGTAFLFILAGIIYFNRSNPVETQEKQSTIQNLKNDKLSSVKKEQILEKNKSLGETELPKNKENSNKNLNLVSKKPKNIIEIEPGVIDSVDIKPKQVKEHQQSDSPKTIKENKNDKIETDFSKTRAPRKVRAIQTTQQVPFKYKDEKYSFNDLVKYNGGNKNLEKELLSKLKGKIKDTDIPQKHSSVVFKFTVTSKGKVKDVNIQSMVTPELESLIKETTLQLDAWDRGSKRIPLDYTVFITFK